MAKRITRTHMNHIHAAAEHLHAVGANYPGMPDHTPIGKADMSLGEQIQAVARMVDSASGAADYCYIEEVFDSYVIIETSGDKNYRADYSIDTAGAVTLQARDGWVEVEQVWQEVTNTNKADLLNTDQSSLTPYASMKAVGDRLLEVKVAYYGHKSGKDSHNEFFSPNTDFDPDNFPAPPLLYYHGFDANGKKMGKPAVTGKFQSRRVGSDGHYLTYKLKNTKYSDLQWESAQKGACVVSPGTIGHLIRKDSSSGELLYWPLAEISAWDYAANRAPANLHSVAAPVIKALYSAEGLQAPSFLLDTAASETPEAVGDTASERAHSGGLSPEQAARIIATEIAASLLAKNTRNQS